MAADQRGDRPDGGPDGGLGDVSGSGRAAGDGDASGDVERELRHAMVDHVSELTASRSLAHDVLRRHRRHVIRSRVLVAASVVAFAAGMVPVYDVITYGGPGGGQSPGTGVAGTARPLSPPPSGRAPSSAPTEQPRSRPTPTSTGSASGGADSTAPERSGTGGRLGYLPAGFRPAGECAKRELAGRTTTRCRWEAGSGLDRRWIELRVIDAPGVSRAADLRVPLLGTEQTRVKEAPALVGLRPDGGRQVVWVPRRGLGASIAGSAGTSADELMKIANGARLEP
jgi:hypothetical protein